jgi:hypothetical protein
MAMTSKQLAEKLHELHEDLITNLSQLIKGKEASNADRVLAWKVLQDNHVPLANLAKELEDSEKEKVSAEEFTNSLPFPGEDDRRNRKVIG